MKQLSKLALAAAVTLAVLSVQPERAEARAERTSYYDYAQVWRAAVRFLRLDEGHKIVERDLKAGYVIFEYKFGGNTYTGFLELIQLIDRSGQRSVRMVIRIKRMPKYTEAGMLYRLEMKLRKELGPYRRHVPARTAVRSRTPAPAKKSGKKK